LRQVYVQAGVATLPVFGNLAGSKVATFWQRCHFLATLPLFGNVAKSFFGFPRKHAASAPFSFMAECQDRKVPDAKRHGQGGLEAGNAHYDGNSS